MHTVGKYTDCLVAKRQIAAGQVRNPPPPSPGLIWDKLTALLARDFSTAIQRYPQIADCLLERGGFELSSPLNPRSFPRLGSILDSPEKNSPQRRRFRKSPCSSNSTRSASQSGLCASLPTAAEK